MKKEETSKSHENSFGIAAVVLGIVSIVLASLNGLLLAIVALVFASKQQSHAPNRWGKNGKILAVIGIILSILAVAFSFWIARNPQILSGLQ